MGSFQSIARIIGLLIGGLLACLSVAFGVFFLINAVDEGLKSGARAALEARHDSVAAEDNLYFAVLGLNFESDADPNELGRQVYKLYLDANRAAPGKKGSLYQDVPFTRQPVVGDETILCGRARQQEDCIERARTAPDALQHAVDSNRALVNRYRTIQKYVRMQNPLPLTINSPILEWKIYLSAKRLWLTELALLAAEGHLDAAVDSFREEFLFTRRVLAEPDILLIDKVVLANSTRMDLGFISDLMREGAWNDAEYSELARTITPLNDDERSLASVFSREFTAYAALFDSLAGADNRSRFAFSDGDQRWWHGLWGELGVHFLKRNATLNTIWSAVEKNQNASRAPCRELAKNREKSLPAPHIAAYVYNPIGKILSRSAVAGGDEYIQSMCDLQGMVAIVALQRAIGARHLQDAAIGDFVRGAVPADENPYTGQPFDWNESAGSLNFQPGAARNRNYFPWPIVGREHKDRH